MTEQYLTINHLSTKDITRLFEKIKINKESGCWEWIACKSTQGYGFFGWHRKNQIAHRIVYAWLVEPLPMGQRKGQLNLDHLCRNRGCVNPAHLELVTMTENIRRGISPWAKNSAKTHCKRGHEYSEENVYILKDGSRECRKCRHWKYASDPEHAKEMDRIRRKRYYDRHAEARREKTRQWRLNNPEKHRAQVERARDKKRALKMQAAQSE